MEKRIEMIESEGEHWYPSPTIEGKYYPSVTTITSLFPKGKGFEMYLARQNSWEDAQDTLKEAGKRGTIVHETSERLEKGEVIQRDMFNLEQWKMLMGFVEWYKEFRPEIVSMEEMLVSDKYCVGGRIDRVYMIDGKRTLLDIKTSAKIYGSHWVQTGMYAALWMEKYPEQYIEQTAILRLTDSTKKGYQYEVHDIGEVMEDKMVFDALKITWHYQNRTKTGPTEVEVPVELSINLNEIHASKEESRPKKGRKKGSRKKTSKEDDKESLLMSTPTV